MKQKLKDGLEDELISQKRKRNRFKQYTGVWRWVKRKIHKRTRKEAKHQILKDIDENH